VERLYILAPPLLLLAILSGAFLVYCALCATGRAPTIAGVKHNQILGPFIARYIVWVLGPIERSLVGRVSPNAITAVSLVMFMLAGVAIATDHPAGASWMIGVAGILDILDGRLARIGNQQSASGALVDSVADRWGELFVFAGYLWFLQNSPWLVAVMAAIGGSMMVSYTRARAESLGVALSGGVMQRAERITLVACGSVVAAWCGAGGDAESAALVDPILGITMLICGVASTATALSRWITAYRELARRHGLRGSPDAPVPSPPAPARVLIPPVRKVAPLEQS